MVRQFRVDEFIEKYKSFRKKDLREILKNTKDKNEKAAINNSIEAIEDILQQYNKEVK